MRCVLCRLAFLCARPLTAGALSSFRTRLRGPSIPTVDGGHQDYDFSVVSQVLNETTAGIEQVLGLLDNRVRLIGSKLVRLTANTSDALERFISVPSTLDATTAYAYEFIPSQLAVLDERRARVTAAQRLLRRWAVWAASLGAAASAKPGDKAFDPAGRPAGSGGGEALAAGFSTHLASGLHANATRLVRNAWVGLDAELEDLHNSVVEITHGSAEHLLEMQICLVQRVLVCRRLAPELSLRKVCNPRAPMKLAGKTSSKAVVAHAICTDVPPTSNVTSHLTQTRGSAWFASIREALSQGVEVNASLWQLKKNMQEFLGELRLEAAGGLRRLVNRTLSPVRQLSFGDAVPLTPLASRPMVYGRAGSLCASGYLVPQMYVLGAMKAGTTLLADTFLQMGVSFALTSTCQRCSSAGVVPAASKADCESQGGYWHMESLNVETQEECANASGVWEASQPTKERNVFNRLGRFDARLADFGNASFLAELVEGFPACPTATGPPTIGADFSATYLADPMAALRMRITYGSAATRLSFVVMLREPLGRLQSAYHHLRLEPWYSGSWSEPFRALGTFQLFSERLLIAHSVWKPCPFGIWASGCAVPDTPAEPDAGLPGELRLRLLNVGLADSDVGGGVGSRTDSGTSENAPSPMVELDLQLLRMLDGSLYGSHMQRWLGIFEPQQFLVVPMQMVTRGGAEAARTLQEIMSLEGNGMFSPNAASLGAAILKDPPATNSHGHPPPETELEERTRRRLRGLFTGDVKNLIALLTAQTQLRLAGFDAELNASSGPRGSREQAVRGWLWDNW